MNTIPDPENWLDVLTIIAVALIAAVPAVFAAKAHKTSEAVLSQTKNGHQVPMRQDLDRVIAAIEALSHDVTAIRRDLAAEEDRRRNHVAELREEVHRRIEEVHRRLKD